MVRHISKGIAVRSSSGFTLLEVLVVIVLTSLISTILMQGLFHVFDMTGRLQNSASRQQIAVLQEHWFRHVSSSLTPDQPGGNNEFQGEKNWFTGLTLAPLRGHTGCPTMFVLEIQRNSGVISLIYREEETTPLVIGKWPESESFFEYIDHEGIGYSQWPEKNIEAQLPESIIFRRGEVDYIISWYSHISGRKQPRPDALEALRGT